MKTTLSTGLNASLLQEQAAVITVSQTASVLRNSITNYIRKVIYVHSVLDCDIAAQPILMLFILFQLERNVHFPPVALGDRVDIADRDVVLLEPELDGVANDVQLLRQRLVGDGCRLHGLTYKVRPFPACQY